MKLDFIQMDREQETKYVLFIKAEKSHCPSDFQTDHKIPGITPDQSCLQQLKIAWNKIKIIAQIYVLVGFFFLKF